MIAQTDANKVITNYFVEGIGMINTAGERRFYRENAIGSAVAIGHGGGGQESESLYDAYGVERYTSGNVNQRGPLRFAARHGCGFSSNGAPRFMAPRNYLASVRHHKQEWGWAFRPTSPTYCRSRMWGNLKLQHQGRRKDPELTLGTNLRLPPYNS